MMILTESYGNNSNVLFQNLHLAAFCRKYDVEFVNPFICKYSEIFPNLRKDTRSLRRFSNIELKIRKLFSHNFGVNESHEKQQQWLLSRGNRKTWVRGWGFRSYKDTEEQRQSFRDFFTPICNDKILSETDIIKKNGKVLSVHIRRGDYRTWNSGQYFYDDATYSELIRKTMQCIQGIGTIQIFSNEEIDMAFFRMDGVNVVAPKGLWFEDQWRMSLSDAIVGPPSTFSLWASYIGSVPIWQVKSQIDDVTMVVANG